VQGIVGGFVKGLFAALSLLILLSAVAAQEIDLVRAGSLDADVLVTWSVNITGNAKSVDTLKLVGTLVSNDSRQQITEFTSSAPYKLEQQDGDMILTYQLDKPKQDNEIRTQTSVRVDYDTAELVDAQYPFTANIGYLEETNLTKTTPEMRQKAKEIVAGANSSLEAIARMTEWVHNYVNYSLGPSKVAVPGAARGVGYGDVTLPAADVFRVREGACDEYSHLLIAMLKSQGIPSRVATGFVSSGNAWGPHAWVEAYVPGDGWIAIDPTFNEAGLLDATHIKMASAPDQSMISERATVFGKEDVELLIDRNVEVRVSSVHGFGEIVSGKINTTEMGEREEEVAVNIVNERDSPVFVPLTFVVPEGLSADRASRMIVLGARENRTEMFEVHLPQLEQSMIYTFPVSVRTTGTSIDAEFTRTTAVAQQTQNASEVPGKQARQTEQPTCVLSVLLALMLVVSAVLESKDRL